MYQDSYQEYAEIDLRECINLLWKNKLLIIGIVFFAVLVAALVSQFYLPEVFQANATLYAPSFTLLNGEKLDNTVYNNFFYRAELIEEIIQEYNLREENPNISYENLSNKIEIDIDRDTNIIRLSLQDTSPQLASNMLKTWYELAQEELLVFIDNRNDRYLQELENTMDKHHTAYLSYLDDLREFQEEVNLGLLKSELGSAETRLIESKNSLDDLSNFINQNEKEYEFISESLEQTERFVNFTGPINNSMSHNSGNIDNNAYNLDDDHDNIDSLSEFLLESEILNPQYVNLERRKNILEQNLIRNKQELDFLERQIPIIEKRIASLQREIANHDGKRIFIEQELEKNQSNYKSAESRYQDSLQNLSNNSYQISVINAPVVPSNRISPNKKLNIAIAGLLGLMISVFFVFFREYMKEEILTEDASLSESNIKLINKFITI